MPLPLNEEGLTPSGRIYVAPASIMPVDWQDQEAQANLAAVQQQGGGLPVAQPQQPVEATPPTGASVVDQLLGTNGQERYQLWPEKLIRDALSAPHDVLNSKTPLTSQDLIKPALDMSAVAGTGGLGGVGAEAGTSLGAGPFLRPALKYEGKIYKAPMGGEHMDAIPADLRPEFTRQAMSGEDISNFNFGFMNHKGQFLDREKALNYAIDNGLLSPHDAKYGALTSTMDLNADSSKAGIATKLVSELGDWFLKNHGREPTQSEINNVMKTRAGQIKRDITEFNKNEGAEIAYAPREHLKQIKQYLRDNEE